MWDRSTKRSEIDVLLPLELEDLASSRPGPTSTQAYAASWQLRKASLFGRLRDAAHGENDATARAAHAEGLRAERIGLATVTDVVRGLVTELDLDQETWADPIDEQRKHLWEVA